jgi:hypothetical protein
MGRRRLAVIAGLLLCYLPGCGPKDPKTYPRIPARSVSSFFC